MTDRTLHAPSDLDRLDFGKGDGLVPVVAQDAADGRALMVAFATREALERSLTTGRMHFWSRARGRLWMKGEESGNALEVVSLHADCDADCVLARVRPAGPACHTGEATCFGEGAVPEGRSGSGPAVAAGAAMPRTPEAAGAAVAGAGTGAAPDASLGAALAALDRTLASREVERPEGSYTARLLDDENLRLKKLGEETAELVAALARGEDGRIPEEAADLLYHLLVALRGARVDLADVARTLEARRK